jgi:hypothetical protein
MRRWTTRPEKYGAFSRIERDFFFDGGWGYYDI